jgi:hypothetical protein
VFVTYIVGFALILVTEAVCNIITSPLMWLVLKRRKAKYDEHPPWRDPELQSVLRLFCPKSIDLPPEALWNPSAVTEWIQKIRTSRETPAELLSSLSIAPLHGAEGDAVWKFWYHTAVSYLALTPTSPLGRVDERAYFMNALQSLGSASIGLLIIKSASNPWLWTVAILAVLVGTLGMFASSVTRLSLSEGPPLAALLLQELNGVQVTTMTKSPQ